MCIMFFPPMKGLLFKPARYLTNLLLRKDVWRKQLITDIPTEHGQRKNSNRHARCLTFKLNDKKNWANTTSIKDFCK